MTHRMDLNENDVIDVEIVKNQGKLDISVTDEEDNIIYKADDASSGMFSLEIPRSGIVEFKVSGRNASGLVSFIVR